MRRVLRTAGLLLATLAGRALILHLAEQLRPPARRSTRVLPPPFVLRGRAPGGPPC